MSCGSFPLDILCLERGLLTALLNCLSNQSHDVDVKQTQCFFGSVLSSWTGICGVTTCINTWVKMSVETYIYARDYPDLHWSLNPSSTGMT